MTGKCGSRNQVDGLVYSQSKMPSPGKINGKYDNNGWNYVIRQNGLSAETYIFETTHDEGKKTSITIQKLNKHNDKNENMENITEACDHVLKSHNPVRDVEHESGVMKMVGWRRDGYKGTCRKYRPRRKIDRNNTNRYGKIISQTLVKLFQGTAHETKLKKAIKDNKLGENELPTIAISEDLTNSIHVDPEDCSESFGFWFSRKGKKGRTWVLFPYYSLAIECSHIRPMLITWDGRCQEHCSCTVGRGVLSLAGFCKTKHINFMDHMKGFTLKPREDMTLEVGKKVDVLLPQENNKKKRRLMNKVGIISSINGNSRTVLIDFVGKEPSREVPFDMIMQKN